MGQPRHIRVSGGYRELRSFQTTSLVYDATVAFCERWVDKRSRTNDQMVQAARSGRQNIAEGSRAAATSSQTELRLVNVARASLEELLLDYEDFLRQHGERLWSKDSEEAQAVRNLGGKHETPTDLSDLSAVARSAKEDQFGLYHPWLTHEDPTIVANTIICLIHQANYLLDRQISGLEREFVYKGGYSEQLAAKRLTTRHQQPAPSPTCPTCQQPMLARTARQGPNAGAHFWGCSAYPNCKATLPYDG